MTWNRREVLASLGAASASALWFALGCRTPGRATLPPVEASGEVRAWLHEAVARLVGAGFGDVHALAVSRTRTTAALDVLGAGVGRARCDGVVLAVRGRDGVPREQVTSDLSRAGVAAAARALAEHARPAAVDFGRPQVMTGALAPSSDPRRLADKELLDRVAALARRDPAPSSRIVYASALLDIDDATVWSAAPGRDLEQRTVRVRRAITRVAWNGARPVVSEAARAWAGGVDDQDLSLAEIVGAREAALVLMTPGAFEPGERGVVLAPAVAAAVIDAAVRALFTSTAARRPEVRARVASGAHLAAAPVTLVDDPAAPTAYGGFAFDDEGQPAAAVTLLDAGRVAGRLGDRAGAAAQLAASAGRGRRPGHVGPVEPAASHLRVAAGTTALSALRDDGFVLEGPREAMVDPGSGRAVIAVSRARELRGGQETGRVYPDVELVGELPALLAAVAGTSRATATFGIRDERDGLPRWRSIEAPWLRTRGLLRPRRSAR